MSDFPDPAIEEGACFGWYSPVHQSCKRCLKKTHCHDHTTMLQQIGRAVTPSDLLQVLDKEIADGREKKEAKKQALNDELTRRAFFDQVVNFLKSHIRHDNIHFHNEHIYASFKLNNRVVFQVSRNKKCIRLSAGPSNESIREEIDFGLQINDMRTQVLNFVKANYDPDED